MTWSDVKSSTTPASFSLLIQDLGDLGYHAFAEVACHPTVGFEFYVTLSLGEAEGKNRKDRITLLNQARAEQVEVSPAYVELQAEVEHLTRVLAHEERVSGETAAKLMVMKQHAEMQIAALMTSTSWRVTRPLRGLTDLALKLWSQTTTGLSKAQVSSSSKWGDSLSDVDRRSTG